MYMHVSFYRTSAKEQEEAESDPEEPIGLASDGEVDAELAKLLSKVDEVLTSSSINMCKKRQQKHDQLTPASVIPEVNVKPT